MQLNIPDEVVQNELTDSITAIVLTEIEKRLKLSTKSSELPPYPNKTQVKKILGIGDEKLCEWIASGLPVIQWSSKEQRIDREDIKEFLNKRKI